MQKLCVENLTKIYEGKNGPVKAVDNVSFSIEEGDFTVIVGPSGCGKTTIMKLLLGLEDFEGSVSGTEGMKFACVFQEDILLPWMNAEDNVKLVCRDAVRARKELEFAEIADAADKYPDELSGGMKRRVCLAQALSADADLIVLDEAFTGMDEALRSRLINKVKTRFSGTDTTVIALSHGAEVSAAADEIIEISREVE